MKLIKIDDVLVEIPEYNYSKLLELQSKANRDHNSLAELSKARTEYFDYLAELFTIGRYPNIPSFKSHL